MMHFVCLDFESYFNTKEGYSLKRMTTESYIRDPRFRAHGAAIYAPTLLDPGFHWREREQLPGLFASLPWSDIMLLCHHSHFDALILNHHYGVRPRLHLDTLSMARLLLGNHVRVGLGSLAEQFELQSKNVPYKSFDGRQWEECALDVRNAIAGGARHDVELTVQIFQKLKPYFPAGEYPLVDMTVRMFTEPCLVGDVATLQATEAAEIARKRDLLAAIGLDNPNVLRADETFATLLRDLDVEPETKQGKNGPIYAFALTDRFMDDLLGSDDEQVIALAEARLAVQSSIQETRARRLAEMAGRGPLCLYLAYCGAATTRWSGGDRLNPQNLTPELQASIQAPNGYQLLVADASQIECRLLNYRAGQADVVERFRTGGDPYTTVASAFYGRAISKEKDPEERQVGKLIELSSGYGAGGDTIARILRVNAGIRLDYQERVRARDAYRRTHARVVGLWGQAETALRWLAEGKPKEWGPVAVRDGCLWLPNGCPLIYDTLKWEPDGWRVKRRNGWARLYGAKLVENLIQALARAYISDVMNRIIAQGLRIVLSRHDDVVLLVKPDDAEDVSRWVAEEMKKPPAWAKDIPLGCDCRIGGKLKGD